VPTHSNCIIIIILASHCKVMIPHQYHHYVVQGQGVNSDGNPFSDG